MPTNPLYGEELAVAEAAAREAGAAILDIYNRQAASVYEKSDGSAVTDADLAADRIIRDAISRAFPGDPLLTEEGIDDPDRLQSRRCWIVDPIDGTNQFIARNGEFEVMIALVEEGRPVVAVVYQPTEDVLISGVAGQGAWIEYGGGRSRLSFAPVDERDAPRIITSVWLGGPENLPLLNEIAASLGSSEATVSAFGMSVRRFIPGSGIADVLIGMRIGGETSYAWEWDLAAPELIVIEAGGWVSDLFGRMHRYNKPRPRNMDGIVMSVDPVTHARVIAELAAQRERNGAVSETVLTR